MRASLISIFFVFSQIMSGQYFLEKTVESFDSIDISESLISGNGDFIIFKPSFQFQFTNELKVGVLHETNNDWSLIGNTFESDSLEVGFNISISDSGKTIALLKRSPIITFVEIYDWVDIEWVKRAEFVSENNPLFFGLSLTLAGDGNSIAFTSYTPSQIIFDYKIHTYQRTDNNSWIPKGKLIENVSPYVRYATSLDFSFDGNRLVVGSPTIFFPDANGLIEIFLFNTDLQDWSLEQSINSEQSLDYFGAYLKFNSDGDKLVYITYYEDNACVSLASLHDDEWILEKDFICLEYLSYLHTLQMSSNKIAISDDGNIIVIGVPKTTVKAFYNNGTQWNDISQNIKQKENYELGNSISMSNDGKRLVILQSNTSITDFSFLEVYKLDLSLPYQDLNQEEALSIYPNPVISTINIEGQFSKPYNLLIYDLMGHIVLESNNYNSTLNISFLPPGVYYIQIVGHGKPSKFIKL